MIVTRTPVRIPLGGGGTDLPSYYTQYGGFLISAAVDKYIYITVNRRFENSIRVRSSKTEKVSAQELAEEACHLEIERLKEPIGKQDQYLAALGGIVCLEIDRLGSVKVEQLNLKENTLDQLESNCLLFYTGIKRSAGEVLAAQNKSNGGRHNGSLEAMHQIKEIGCQIKRSFQ